MPPLPRSGMRGMTPSHKGLVNTVQRSLSFLVTVDPGVSGVHSFARTKGPGEKSRKCSGIRVMKALGGRLHDVNAKGEATTMDFDINTKSTTTTPVSQLVTLELIDATGTGTP